MADPKQLKMKPRNDFGDGDPLAELTRIMGLAPQTAPEDDQLDDFGIDLERELMGEFAAGNDAPKSAWPRAANVAGLPDQDTFAPARAKSHPDADRPVAVQRPAAPALRVIEPAPATTEAHIDEDALERELGAYLDDDDLYAAPEPQPKAMASFEEPATAEVGPVEASIGDGAAMGSAEQVHEDPLERLQAFQRDWLQRRRSAEAEPDLVGRAADPTDDVEPTDYAEPTGYAEPETIEAHITGPQTDASHDLPFHAEPEVGSYQDAELGTAPETAAADHAAPTHPVGAAWQAQPEPVRTTPAPAAEASDTSGRVFDPFAELMAMANRTAAPAVHEDEAETAQAPVAPVQSAPAPAQARTEPARPAPAVPPRRSNWQPVRPAASTSSAVLPVLEAADSPQPEQAQAAPEDPWAALSAWGGVNDTANASTEREAARGTAPVDLSDDVVAADAGDARLDTFAAEDVRDEDLAAFDAELDLGDLNWNDAQDEPLPAPAADAGTVDARAYARQTVEPAAPAATAAASQWPRTASQGFTQAPMPDVDTVEVPAGQYEVVDEFDVPDLAFDEDVRAAATQDELDIEFSDAFDELVVPRQPQAAQPVAEARIAAQPAARSTAYASQRPADDDDVDIDLAFEEAVRSWEASESQPIAASLTTADQDWFDDGEAAHGFGRRDEVLPSAFHGAEVPPAQRQPASRRGLFAAALVAGVAIAGAVVAFTVDFGGSGGDAEPALVRADPEPVKVKPEKPGGVTIPNQDKAVYERVAAGETASAPAQERLVSTAEEPVDLAVRTVPVDAPAAAADTPSALSTAPLGATPKGEDRIEPADDFDLAPADEVPAIAPRRVRTMIVRPDGTLVQREEPAPAEEAAPVATAAAEAQTQTLEAAAAEPVASAPVPQPAPEPVAQAPIRTSEAAPEPAAAPAEAAAPAPSAEREPPVRTVETRTITRDQAANQTTPNRGPVAPTRPSDQPVEIVGNTGNANRATQVAAAQPVPVTTAPTSEWSMQIASQPSPDGAQASYADLSRRYGAILGGRGVNIVKADIAGKGTFWRVRIPAGSRAEATSLCERYKAAGGSCFVAK